MAAVETRDGLPASGEAETRADRNEEHGFEIDGEVYPLPTLDTITLNEERVLYLYADTVLQDFADAHEDATPEQIAALELLQWRKIRNPDFKRALAHIAYRRKHPEVTDAEVEQAIGNVTALEVDIAMMRGSGDSPPALSSQKQPESRSDTNEPSSPEASGSPTESSSARADESHEPTGTTESDTYSPGAVPIASAR